MHSDRSARVKRLTVACGLVMTALLITAGDWPTYLHDPGRSGSNGSETIISTSNAAQLIKLWSFKTHKPFEASATVVGGTVYVGSWDGYEYALDAVSGAMKWKRNLGKSVNPTPGCYGGAGISSAAAVQNGVLYVGGGANLWYALNATTGAIQWSVYTGDSSVSGGHYNWSSPLIYNGYAYIGIASLCDQPVVQGQLLKVSLATHKVVKTLNIVPAGQIGGAIWSSPSIDTATNTIYVSTGNEGQEPSTTQPQTVAMVAVNATTLAVKGSWQVPISSQVRDSDWTTTPTIFNDTAGHSLVGAINKSGYFYAFDRTNVGNGPMWQFAVANAGSNPNIGYGSVSSGAFGNGLLYVGGGDTTINSVPYSGSVRALDPASGHVVWQVSTSGIVLAGLAYANGLVIDGAGANVEVRDASNGALLFSYKTGNAIWGAPIIANGQIYAGSADSTEYAFGLPAKKHSG